MTLKEIKRKIDAAQAEFEANKVNADGSYNAEAAGKYWESLPRIAYGELPPELQAVADEITVEGAKAFLLENYISYHPDGDLSRYKTDPALFERTITEALHAARYEVKDTDPTLRVTGNPKVDEAIKQARPVSLYANDFMAAWDNVTQEKASPRNAAIEKGALMTIGGRIASYSTDDLKDALNAYSIYRLPSTVDRKRAFDSTGKLNALMLQDKPLEGLTEIHTAFLMAVVQAVSLAQIDGDNTISFYLPSICRDLKIDPRTYSSKRRAGQDYADMRFNAVLEMITPFDPLVGRTPDGSFYRVLTFESYDKGSDTMTISTPYLYRLKAIAEQRATEQKHPQLNRLLHSAAANETNWAAVELANRILAGLVTRGGTRPDYRTYKAEPQIAKKTVTKTSKDGQRTTTTTVYDIERQTDDTPKPQKLFTFSIKYQSLIDDCPQLKRELDECKYKCEIELNERAKKENRTASAEELKQAQEKDKKIAPQRINKKLKDIFTAAFRIIEKKSDAPARYLEFKLPKTKRKINGKESEIYDIPTKSTLSRRMVITHKGNNPKYAK